MNKKKIVISLIIVLAIVALAMPEKTEVEKEIKYYKDEGFKTVKITLTEFYDQMPADLPTREVEVSKEKLRFRIHLATTILDVEKGEMAVCYNPEKTVIYALCFTSISDTIGYVEVLFWEP